MYFHSVWRKSITKNTDVRIKTCMRPKYKAKTQRCTHRAHAVCIICKNRPERAESIQMWERETMKKGSGEQKTKQPWTRNIRHESVQYIVETATASATTTAAAAQWSGIARYEKTARIYDGCAHCTKLADIHRPFCLVLSVPCACVCVCASSSFRAVWDICTCWRRVCVRTCMW